MMLIALAAVAAALSLASPAAAQEAEVSCASIGHTREICRLGRDVSEVRLVRQTSQARCTVDRTWGVERGKLWVDQGCSGVFRVVYMVGDARPTPGGGRPTDQTDAITCGSIGGKPERCAIPRDATWARIGRRTSNARCDWRDTWTAEPGAIWVTRGCAAIFDLAGGRRAPGPDWYEISAGGGRPGDGAGPRPVPGRPEHGDRGDRAEEMIAIRACRRYGEDQPQLFDARWVEARPADTFRADSRGRDIDVEGRYDVIRRGPDQSVSASCRVRGNRVVGFSVR